MLRYTMLSICCLLCTVSSTYADIEVWAGNAGDCDISHIDNTIDINEPGTYGFRAWNGNVGNPVLEDIQNITIDPNVDGDVTITIAYSSAGGDGAAKLWEGDLTHSTETITLSGLEISGNLGYVGGGSSNTFDCDTVSGEISVGGLLIANVTANTLKDVTISGVGTHSGSITTTNTYDHTLTIGLSATPTSTINTNIDIPAFYGLADNEGGRFYFYGDMHGEIDVTGNWCGSMYLTGDLCNDITIGGDLGVYNALYDRAWIFIDGDIADASDPDEITNITVGDDSYRGIIHVKGDMGGRIAIVGDMYGARIHIDGDLKNSNTATGEYEIETASLSDFTDTTAEPPNETGTYRSAIVVDYTGADMDDDAWESGAIVLVNTQQCDEDGDNSRVHEISSCRGDMNNDYAFDSNDETPFDDAISDLDDYEDDYPGLEGSILIHGDLNCDDSFDSDDEDPFDFFMSIECCDSDCEYEACWADLEEDGDVDLADLAVLLSNYGMTSGATHDDGDLYGADGAINISDLAELLGSYGDTCACYDSNPGTGGRSPLTSYVDVTIDAIDTNGYTGGGFSGEVDHFVFDLQIEVDDPNTDDWVATGADLESDNDAEFRLSIAAAYPSQYATFVSAPWTTLPGSATANIAGAYDPPDPNEAFTTTDINIGWYDNVSSNDGPGTVMRIVIDVSDVTGADVSTGFGSVYFSQSGPTGKDDILVATLSSETATAESAPGMKSFSGNFYVKGE